MPEGTEDSNDEFQALQRNVLLCVYINDEAPLVNRSASCPQGEIMNR